MAMDPEIKALVQHLVDMQSRMADRQVAVENALVQLTNRVEQLTNRVDGLAEGQAQLTRTVANLATRLDAFTEAVMRGFTEGAARQGELAARFNTLDARVTALERERRT